MTVIMLIMLALWSTVGTGAGSVAIAADKSQPPADQPASSSSEKKAEPSRRPLQRMEERFLGATPEERARLEAERERLSAAAAAFGTDPTAVVGFYQATYGHTVLTNNLRLDVATATIRVPVTPNWLVQVNMPYAWADVDQSRAFPLKGGVDMTMRTGSRIYANENIAVFLGGDASFPTASERQLGTGKYTVGPGGAVAVPLPRVQSLFFLLVQDFNSIGGDPSRANLHYMRVQPTVNTIWSDHWWTLVSFNWDVDWNSNRKSALNTLAEVGYRFDNHWNFFAGPGVGVVGRDTFLGLDWTVQAGIRWVYSTPLISSTFIDNPNVR